MPQRPEDPRSISKFPLHDAKAYWLVGEGIDRQYIGTQDDRKNEPCGERKWEVQYCKDDEGTISGMFEKGSERNVFLQVVGNGTAFLDA